MFLLLETLVLSDVTKALPSPAPLPLLLFSSFVQENTRDTDWVPSVSLRHMRLIYTNPLPSCLPWECCVWICGWCCHLLVLSPSSICIIKWSQKTDISLCLFFFLLLLFSKQLHRHADKKVLSCFGSLTFSRAPLTRTECVHTSNNAHTQARTCPMAFTPPLKQSFSPFVIFGDSTGHSLANTTESSDRQYASIKRSDV